MVESYANLIAAVSANSAKLRKDIPEVMQGFNAMAQSASKAGALDAKTNEMLIRNAQNTAEQAKMTARLASGSSIKIETLEQTWRTIVSGIDETKQIQENARKQRVEDQKRLEAIKAQFDQMYHMPDKGSVNH